MGTNNIEALFLNTASNNLSILYTSLGCQHSMELPDANDVDWFQPDFSTPELVPVLTEKGFVRWQTLMTLLNPDRHIPFIQRTVGKLSIEHPEIRQALPTDLPLDGFLAEIGETIEKWVTDCSDKVRQKLAADAELEKWDNPWAEPA